MRSKPSTTVNSDTSLLDLAKTKAIPAHLQSLQSAGIKTLADLLWALPLRLSPMPKLKPFSQVETLLQEIKENEFSLGLVTSSERVITHALLEKSGYKKYFDLIITLQDVKDPKPHPGPYIMAMQQLNIGRLECVIFEDSPTGLRAALDSGCRSIKVDWWN